MDPRIAWNAGADAWHEFVRSGADYYRTLVHGPALLAACRPLSGVRALDLGCGQGYFSRELARGGAVVTGVDLSEELLRFAREREVQEQLGIDYLHLDAAEVADTLPRQSFDLVTGCMSLQDMDEVAGVIGAARRMLRRGGRMVFSIPHPCSDTPFREWERDEAGEKLALKIDRYFEAGRSVMHWNMARLKYHWSTPHWRRTLEEWTMLAAGGGFLIRRLLEPRPAAEQVRANPELDDCYRLPYFLIFDLVGADG